MTIEELKALIAIGQDCGEAEMKALWPEILALVEAASGLYFDTGTGEWDGADGTQKALAAFNAKLEAL